MTLTTGALALLAIGVGAIGLGAMFGCVFCNDGWLSRSFGRRGACSHHGGWRD